MCKEGTYRSICVRNVKEFIDLLLVLAQLLLLLVLRQRRTIPLVGLNLVASLDCFHVVAEDLIKDRVLEEQMHLIIRVTVAD